MEFYWPLVLVLDKLLRRKFDNPWVKFLKMESLKFIYYFWAVFLFYYYVFFLMTGMVGAYADSKGRAGGGLGGWGGSIFILLLCCFCWQECGKHGGGGWRERERGGQCSAEKFQNRGEKSGDIVTKNGGTVIWQLKISFPSFLSTLWLLINSMNKRKYLSTFWGSTFWFSV